ncbi:MAG TPA: hypothetical protein VKU01_04635 [Bryobacteraceae bacterium]|nr:hypothetical protein [Bryobacteraceae bacterium]
MNEHKIFHLKAVKSDQGIISGEFETRHNGPGTVSSGKLADGTPDGGGQSFGLYQFTSQDLDKNGKPVKNGGTVGRFVNSKEGEPWRKEFKDAHGKDLDPQSKEFKAKWQEIAKRDPETFAQAQQAFTGRNYYYPQADRLTKIGVDMEHRSVTLQNVVWSTSVQHGAGNPIMGNAIEKKAHDLHKKPADMTDGECIDAIYDARVEHNPRDRRRYREEHQYAKNMLRYEQEEAQSSLQAEQHGLAPVPPHLSDGMSRQAQTGQPAQSSLQAQPGEAMGGLVPVPEDLARQAIQQIVSPSGQKQQAGVQKDQQGAQGDEEGAQDERDELGGHKKSKVKSKQKKTAADYNPVIAPKAGGL